MSTATEILMRMEEASRMLGAAPPIQSEMRLHPDDIAALRRQFGVTTIATGPFNSFSGIKIIPDVFAERLPRKAP